MKIKLKDKKIYLYPESNYDYFNIGKIHLKHSSILCSQSDTNNKEARIKYVSIDEKDIIRILTEGNFNNVYNKN